MIVVRSCGKVLGACTQVCEERDFWTFDLLENGHVSITLFEDINPIFDSREKFHREGPSLYSPFDLILWYIAKTIPTL